MAIAASWALSFMAAKVMINCSQECSLGCFRRLLSGFHLTSVVSVCLHFEDRRPEVSSAAFWIAKNQWLFKLLSTATKPAKVSSSRSLPLSFSSWDKTCWPPYTGILLGRATLLWIGGVFVRRYGNLCSRAKLEKIFQRDQILILKAKSSVPRKRQPLLCPQQ